MLETPPQKKAQLLLEDGTLFEGTPFGKSGTVAGEICFNTGMTGYQELMTDPSSTGQILVFSNCYVGNYGMYEKDALSDGIKIQGLICKEIGEDYSRKIADSSLQEALVKDNVVGVYGIDTRALVSHIRDKGAMNAILSTEGLSKSELGEKLSGAPSIKGRDIASEVSTKEVYEFGEVDADLRIAVLDLGIKKSVLSRLAEVGALLKVFPARTTCEQMEDFNPDAYFISDGPGDPSAMDYAVSTVGEILATDKPLFGVCLGFQLLALANQVSTFKMHHGHRGFNHPVLNKITNKSGITTQNHGFDIDAEEVKNAPNIEITHINLNDNTVEGFRIKDKVAFGVQFNPDSEDSRYLFDDFTHLIERNKKMLV